MLLAYTNSVLSSTRSHYTVPGFWCQVQKTPAEWVSAQVVVLVKVNPSEFQSAFLHSIRGDPFDQRVHSALFLRSMLPWRKTMTIEEVKTSISTALERNKLLDDAEVKALTKIGKTKRNSLIKAGHFPQPLQQLNEHQLPGRTNYWLQGEILDYLQVQIDARNQRLAEIASHGLNGWLNQAIEDAAGARNA
jgi:predicted DNA-binding transcriptional regulator AlpA